MVEDLGGRLEGTGAGRMYEAGGDEREELPDAQDELEEALEEEEVVEEYPSYRN